jgi:hypothetical protein
MRAGVVIDEIETELICCQGFAFFLGTGDEVTHLSSLPV